MGFVHDRDNTTTAADKLLARNLSTARRSDGGEVSSSATWYRGDLVAKELRTSLGRSVGTYLGMLSVTLGFGRGIQRTTERRRTRGTAGTPVALKRVLRPLTMVEELALYLTQQQFFSDQPLQVKTDTQSYATGIQRVIIKKLIRLKGTVFGQFLSCNG